MRQFVVDTFTSCALSSNKTANCLVEALLPSYAPMRFL